MIPEREAVAGSASSVRGRRGHRRWGLTRWVALTLGMAVAAGVAVVAPRLGEDPGTEVAAHSPLLGQPAPAFSLPDVNDGAPINSATFAGRLYVVNFFASWCPACVAETPELVSFYRRWHPAGVDIIGVGYADNAPSEATFARRWGIHWPLVTDPGDRLALAYGVFGIPETFFIGPDGRILAKLVGAAATGQLDQVARRLVAGSGPIVSHSPDFVPLAPGGGGRGG